MLYLTHPAQLQLNSSNKRIDRAPGRIRLVMVLFALLVLFAALVPSNLADFVIENGQISALDTSGMTSTSFKFSTKKSSSMPEMVLSDENTLKLTFEILARSASEEAAKPILPRQVNLLATGLDTKLHWAAVIKARATGKAKWELDLARAPTDFLSISRTGDVLLELVIADSDSKHAPLRLKLANLKIPKALLLEYPYWDTKDGKPPAALELEKYYLQPLLQWTFQAPRKRDNPIISLIFIGIVVSPWMLLLSVWSKLSSRSTPSFKLFSSPTSSMVLFIVTLISQEALILTYWATLKLYQYLPIAFFFSMPLILSGRRALSELRVRRKKNPIGASHVLATQLSHDKAREKAE